MNEVHPPLLTFDQYRETGWPILSLHVEIATGDGFQSGLLHGLQERWHASDGANISEGCSIVPTFFHAGSDLVGLG